MKRSDQGIRPYDLAEWFAETLDVPHEIHWGAHAIGLIAHHHRGWLADIAVGRPNAPADPPKLLRLLTYAPVLALLIVWVRRTPRFPLATLLVVAILAHAIRHPSLYHGEHQSIRDHLRQAGLAIRKLCKRAGNEQPDEGHADGAIARGIHALQAFLSAPTFELDAATEVQLTRLLSWLRLAPAPLVRPPKVAGVAEASVPLPRSSGNSHVVDESIDARTRSTEAVESATTRDADGEVDPDDHVTLVRPALPGVRNLLHRGMRMAASALGVRAAGNAAGLGRVARLEALTDGVISDLGRDLEEDAPLAARVLIPGALYSGLPLAVFERLRICERHDEVGVMDWAILRHPLGLLVPARAAAGLPAPEDEWASSCVVPGSHAALPLPMDAPFARDIAHWVETRDVGAPIATTRERRDAREWLAAHALQRRSPVTPRRLATVLREACRATGAGLAEEALVLGRSGGAMGAANAYHVARPATLIDVHLPAIAWISERLGGPRYLTPPTPLGRAVGSRRVPTPDAVMLYMAQLREITLRRPARRPTLDEQRAYHLRLQALVAEIALWCTGARPFARALDGLLDAGEFILIDDKARPGGKGTSHARAVPVCTLLRMVIEAWRAHRDEVAKRHGIASMPRGWFEIMEDGTVREMPWKDVRAPLPSSGMAWNASRQWFRTRLGELGVKGPVLDAWMGHAMLGGEPGHSLGTRAPAQVDPRSLELLERMVRELGLPVIGGRT